MNPVRPTKARKTRRVATTLIAQGRINRLLDRESPESPSDAIFAMEAKELINGPPHREGAWGEAGHAAVTAGSCGGRLYRSPCGSFTGNTMVAVVPCPSLLAISSLPSCRRASPCTTDSPSPAPSWLRLLALSA